ncbi:hypothetical protein BC826DRAFT_1189725 [Russula brevipes]|nr:hypothetical protein BC826DRAFT_1189725 [Russula brevipes]
MTIIMATAATSALAHRIDGLNVLNRDRDKALDKAFFSAINVDPIAPLELPLEPPAHPGQPNSRPLVSIAPPPPLLSLPSAAPAMQFPPLRLPPEPPPAKPAPAPPLLSSLLHPHASVLSLHLYPQSWHLNIQPEPQPAPAPVTKVVRL